MVKAAPRKHLRKRRVAPAAQVPETGLGDFLKSLSEGLDGRIEEAKAVVRARLEALDEAQRDLKTLEALAAIRKGKFPVAPLEGAQRRSAGPRGPRTAGKAIQDKIGVLLKNAGTEGLPVSEIIQNLAPSGDAKEGQRVRNQLVAMKKNNVLGARNGFYFLAT